MSAQGLIEMLSAQEGTTATVERPITTKVNGFSVPSYQPHLLSVKVHVQDKTGSETVRYGAESARKQVVIYAEHGSDIQEKDRIVVGTRKFDVQNAHDRGFDSLAHRRCECEETL